MARRADLAVAGLTAALAAVALFPAAAQRSPQSILPPGFDQPEPASRPAPKPKAKSDAKPVRRPASEPARAVPSVPPAPRTPAAEPPTDLLPPNPPASSGAGDDGVGNMAAAIDVPAIPYRPPSAGGGGGEGDSVVAESDGDSADNVLDNITAVPEPLDLPPEAQRSLARIGLADHAATGFGEDAFGITTGAYLRIIMDRTRAPLVSRWGSILLRRALVAQVATPADINGADWAASRAWMLVRMGEADNARALVSQVDVDNYTPWLSDVALQTSLASADPASFCAFQRTAGAGAAWTLVKAMCAGLSGEGGTAGALIDEARRRNRARGIDVLLAEKVAAVGSNTRRAINIQWDGVQQLNAWRFGLASGTGVVIPDRLYATVGPQVQAWLARAPLLPQPTRLAAADRAAVLGVFSNAALSDIYAAMYDALDVADRDSVPVANTLRRAFVGSYPDRAAALASLWKVDEPTQRYARQILGARAAALLPRETPVGDVDSLIAAMLSAGFDIQAARWSGQVDTGSLGWALLAVGAPRPDVTINAGSIGKFAGGDAARGGLLIAALAGLGRIGNVESVAADNDVSLNVGGSWVSAIDAAAGRREPGTVALLAATGLQGRSWADVTPGQFYHVIAALRIVGLEPEARMIAAEALTRRG